MILFDLICKNHHQFEAWFPSSDQYEVQRKKGLIKCPYCNTTSVKKSLMAPSIKLSNEKKYNEKKVIQSQYDNEMLKQIKKIKNYVNNSTEDVGQDFAEEARKIYYGETKARPIRGEATQEETKSLNEEGVPFSRLPWSSKEDA